MFAPSSLRASLSIPGNPESACLIEEKAPIAGSTKLTARRLPASQSCRNLSSRW
jgi:hypothetical protein